MNIKRILQLNPLLDKKSFFLLGPRQVGKSHIIKTQLKECALIINLLDSDVGYRLQSDPSYLKALVAGRKDHQKYVVIDEIQKNPELLNLVHLLIEEKNIRFLLTGSSSRKLKKANVNLLAGRAWNASLFPLSWVEIPELSLNNRLLYGSLPYVYLSAHPLEELKAYVTNYLLLEVQIEGMVRLLPHFQNFLKSAALTNTQILNFTKIGSDSGVSPSSVRDYYGVLQDLLLGFMVFPWKGIPSRKTVSKAKFYFFDIGLVNVLCGISHLNEHSNFYGRNFEHFIGSELRAYLSYTRKDISLNYWQSQYGQEVDFILGGHTAIEVKSSRKISKRDIKSLKILQKTKKLKRFFIVSRDEVSVDFEGIKSVHWKIFLKDLWNHQIF